MDQAVSVGVEIVQFIGGEPTLDPMGSPKSFEIWVS
jgi:hypothetical protein